MPKMSKMTASYIAGFTDGEGYIAVNKIKSKTVKSNNGYTYRPCIKIANTNREIMEWFKNSFGGSLYVNTSRNKYGHKTSYEWSLRDKSSAEFIKKIYPYLKIKKRQAEIAIIVAKHKENHKYNQIVKGFQGVMCKSKEDWQILEDYYQETLRLNKRGFVVQDERLSGEASKEDAIVHV
jgi:hypothetical protein